MKNIRYLSGFLAISCLIAAAPSLAQDPAVVTSEAAAVAQVATASPATVPVAGYLLQPGDVLQVSVWKETELQAEAVIRPDGGLSFPLAGDIPLAANRTVDQLRLELENRLRRLVPEAVVFVTLKTPAGNQVYVVGKVNKPGNFIMNRPTDVMQALSMAAGATPFADVNDI